MEIVINEARACEVFQILQREWDIRGENGALFNGMITPEDRYPYPEDKKESSLWLFYGCLPMRGGMVSDDPFKWLNTMRISHPQLFNPYSVADSFTPDDIVDAFKSATETILNGNGTGTRGAGALGYKMEEHAQSWYANSRVLVDHWGGDILSVFEGVSDFEEAFTKIDRKRRQKGKHTNEAGFFGMRRKIFSLLTIWFQNKNLIPVFPTPIPIDFHALRVLWATGVFDYKDLLPFDPSTSKTKKPEKQARVEALRGREVFRITESRVDFLAKWSQRFMVQEGFSHQAINPAIWFLSREFCAKQLQTRSRDAGTSLFYEERLRESPELWPESYEDPCVHCSMDTLCTGSVVTSPYYTLGLLTRLKRVPYPYGSQRLLPQFSPQGAKQGRKGVWAQNVVSKNGNGIKQNSQSTLVQLSLLPATELGDEENAVHKP